MRENEIDNNLHERFALEDKVITSATTTTATFTTTTSSSWSALIASFIPSTTTTLSSNGGYSTTTFAYDSNGNLASTSAGLTNTWDYNNRLTQTVQGTTTTYAYDDQGNRVKYANGQTTTYYPNKLYDVTGTTTVKHFFVGDRLIATVKGNSSATSTYYAHTDHLGSPTVITNASSTIVETTDYEPYGNTRFDNNTTTFKEQRKFTNKELDQDTGLTYFGARYVNTRQGQFTSLDPSFLAIGRSNFERVKGG